MNKTTKPMIQYSRIVFISVVCMSLLLCACKKKEEPAVAVNYMTGTLSMNIPAYLYRDKTYTFSAEGISEPQEGISYFWDAPDFTPGSCFEQTYTFTTPEVSGSYTISLTGSHEDYNSSKDNQEIIIIDSLFFDALSGVSKGSSTFEDPRDGLMYHTREYGDLEWFVHNLSWSGAGNAFAKIEALSIPYGRLYSWNEATSGISGGETPGAACSGLGEGPQGVCPPGWSVPTNEDWAHLASVVSEGEITSFFDSWDNLASPLCAYAKLNEKSVWPYSPHNLKSNSFAWNGLAGGNSINQGQHYVNEGFYGFWLSSSEADSQNGYYRYINYDVNKVPYHHTDKKAFGASVRCVRLINLNPEPGIEE